jgi:hypothetical protein
MAINYGAGATKTSSGVNFTAGVSTAGSRFGRVVDIILDSFHPKYNDLGQSQSINGVFYKPLSAPYTQDTEEELNFAYCGRAGIKHIPLLGEIVVLDKRASENVGLSPTETKTYWTDIVTLWNHPHHNAYPDTNQSGEGSNDFGDYFVEEDKVAPLQCFPGDFILEGRHGQSIRFGGTKYDSNTIIDNSNNGKPVIIISNGQKEPVNGFDPVVEDINEDPTSLYLTSDHTIPLIQANTKRDSWKEEPQTADAFKGAQAILNSGRLYFNAKDESVLISAADSIGLNASTLNFDGQDYAAIDANKIYLGRVALEREDEPVLLGQSTTDLLDDYITLFNTLAKTLATLPPAPPAAIAKLIAVGNQLVPQIPSLKQRLPLLHSKKVFTE